MGSPDICRSVDMQLPRNVKSAIAKGCGCVNAFDVAFIVTNFTAHLHTIAQPFPHSPGAKSSRNHSLSHLEAFHHKLFGLDFHDSAHSVPHYDRLGPAVRVVFFMNHVSPYCNYASASSLTLNTSLSKCDPSS